MDAFNIFIQHWMKEENQLKKEAWLESLHLRQRVACQKVLSNRRTILIFKATVQILMEMIDEGDTETQEFEEMFQIANRLAVDVVVNREIFGVCYLCESGLVEFVVDDTGKDLVAVCKNCDEIHLYLDNIFVD